MNSKQLAAAARIAAWQSCIDDQQALLAELRHEYDLAVAAEKAARGAVSGVTEGWNRLIEFSADELDDDFAARWNDWSGNRRFEFYPLEYGNCIYRDNWKPQFDAERGALKCVVSGNKNGSPSLGTALESPLFSYGGDIQPRYIRAGVPYRFSCEIEFSENMFEMLMWARNNSASMPWCTLAQIKNTGLSWWSGAILLLGWNRGDEHLYLIVQGDSRTDKQTSFENDILINNIPVAFGRRQRLTWDHTLDSSGNAAHTKVCWDEVCYVNDDKPNCVPTANPDNQARGIYIGPYCGNLPALPEPFTVWISNISVDVQNGP